MIEPDTLNRLAHELAEFANGHAAGDAAPLWTPADFDPQDDAAHRLPDEPRSPAQIDALRERARICLAHLATTKRSKAVDPKLLRLAAEWLEDPLVSSTHAAHAFTPMDGLLSLGPSGQLQMAHPRFRSLDARYAVTFAELIQPTPRGKKKKGPPLIGRCQLKACRDFFVQPPLRARPWNYCPRHRFEVRQTKKKPKGDSQ